MTVTSGRHAQKDKERQQRIESYIRCGLKDRRKGVRVGPVDVILPSIFLLYFYFLFFRSISATLVSIDGRGGADEPFGSRGRGLAPAAGGCRLAKNNRAAE